MDGECTMINKSAPILALAVLLISSVFAAGVTTPYWKGTLSSGESIIIYFGLQNGIGDSNLTLRASVSRGSEIASLVDSDTDYLVPLGKEEIKVPVKIQIPADAKIGEMYKITISFRTVESGEGQPLALGQAFDSSTEVTVIEKVPSEKNNNFIWIVSLAILILLIIVIIYYLKKRNGSNQ